MSLRPEPRLSRFTLRQLEYFLAVADTGTISAAAEQLHVSPTAVASALTALEAALETQLVVRRKAYGATLTPAGHFVVDHARRIVGESLELQLSARDRGGELRGPLSLGCYSTLAPSLIPPLLTGFTERHPRVELDFVAGSQRPLEQGLLGGTLDLALLYAMDLSDGLATCELFQAPVYALLHPDHPLARRATVSLTDLAEDPVVFLDVHPSGEHSMSVFHEVGVEPRIRYRTPDFELTRSLVGRGLGYALLVQRPPRPVTFEGLRVVEKRLSPATKPARVVMAWADGVRLTRRAQALLDLAVRTLRLTPD